MSKPSQLRSLAITPLDLPLHEPFGISGGAQAMANNVLVMLELDDGTRGYGEAAPLPPYNGETQADALATLQTARDWLVGCAVGDWRTLAAEFRRRGGAACGSAQCAFETALLDTPLFLASNPFDGGYQLDGGRISVAHIAAGHGVTPRA